MADNVAIRIPDKTPISVQKDDITVVDQCSTLNVTATGSASVTVSPISSAGITINVNNTLQNLFETIAVPSQSNVVADNTNDILTLQPGTGISITTNAATDTITITNTDVFGNNYQYWQDDTLSTTTSTTNVIKLSGTTSSLPSGTYRIGWSAETSVPIINSSVESIVQLNGTEIARRYQEAQDARDWYNFLGFFHSTLSGVNTITIEYRRTATTATTVSIQRARIEIWRVV